jgi:putative endonuclease
MSISVGWPARHGGGIVSGVATAKDAVGQYGERVAVAYLTSRGMRLIDRNWRCSAGEVDAILWDGEVLVFAEVKTRRSGAFGAPAEAVGHGKQARLRRLAAIWLAQSAERAREVRFDLVSVLPRPSGAAEVEHLRGIF